MIKFTDRKGTSINDKILEVKNVERNESGEIIRLEVKEIRNDKVGIIEEGTALNAAQLNEIVDLIYKNAIMQDKERVNNDLNELSVDSKVNTNFKLKTRGEHGSTISWEVISGTGITISGDNAIVTRELYDQNVTIKATITFNNISQDKTFEVTVSKKETTDSDRVNNDLNELSINTVMSNNILLFKFLRELILSDFI